MARVCGRMHSRNCRDEKAVAVNPIGRHWSVGLTAKSGTAQGSATFATLSPRIDFTVTHLEPEAVKIRSRLVAFR